MPETSHIYLTLAGDFDPEEIADMITLQPWQSYKKNSRSVEHSLPRVSRLSYGKIEVAEEVPDVYAMSEQMVDLLEPYRDEFKAVSERSDVEACCSTCLWMMHDLSISTPPIGFSARAIAFIAYVGASIDIDTYRDDEPANKTLHPTAGNAPI